MHAQPDYEQMYYKLFRSVTRAVDLLEREMGEPTLRSVPMSALCAQKKLRRLRTALVCLFFG